MSNYYYHPRVNHLRKGIQGFVDNYSGLLACRFFLGLAEGSDIFRHHSLYSPACQEESFHALYSISLISILGRGYKYGSLEINVGGMSSDVFNRNALFFMSASLSGAFSGLLAAAIDYLDGIGSKPGWAWIFILVRCASTAS